MARLGTLRVDDPREEDRLCMAHAQLDALSVSAWRARRAADRVAARELCTDLRRKAVCIFPDVRRSATRGGVLPLSGFARRVHVPRQSALEKAARFDLARRALGPEVRRHATHHRVAGPGGLSDS